MLDGLSPPRRASSALGRRGAKPGGKPKGGPFHPGGRRRGEDRTGESLEPSLMPRKADPADGKCGGVQGLAAEKRQVPVKETTWPGEHGRPRGREGTHPGRSSCVRNAVTPSGSGRARVSGKPTARRAQLLGGNRMADKRTPVVERRRETTRAGPALQRSSWITGRIRVLVTRLERAQTRPGEPSRRR